METMRLRTIRQPGEVGRLLDSLLSHLLRRSSESLHRISDARQLPLALQLAVRRAKGEGLTWCAWASSTEYMLFAAEMCLDRSREFGRPVLVVNVYDNAGRLHSSSAWLHGRDESWQRCAQ